MSIEQYLGNQVVNDCCNLDPRDILVGPRYIKDL
jgi:hypothetical protein